jgi:hypothetical protein
MISRWCSSPRKIQNSGKKTHGVIEIVKKDMEQMTYKWGMFGVISASDSDVGHQNTPLLGIHQQ